MNASTAARPFIAIEMALVAAFLTTEIRSRNGNADWLEARATGARIEPAEGGTLRVVKATEAADRVQ